MTMPAPFQITPGEHLDALLTVPAMDLPEGEDAPPGTIHVQQDAEGIVLSLDCNWNLIVEKRQTGWILLITDDDSREYGLLRFAQAGEPIQIEDNAPGISIVAELFPSF